MNRGWLASGCLAVVLAACGKAEQPAPPGPAVTVKAATGALLTSADGRARLAIPAGALDRDTEARFVAVQSVDRGQAALSPAYAVHLGGAQLGKAARLEVDIGGSAMKGSGAVPVPVVIGQGKGLLLPDRDAYTVLDLDTGRAQVAADIRHPGHWWVATGSDMGSITLEWSGAQPDRLAGAAWIDSVLVRGKSDADVIPLVTIAGEGQGSVASTFAARPERLQGYQDRFEKPVEMAWQCREPGTGHSQWTAAVEYQDNRGAGGHLTVSWPVHCLQPSGRCSMQGSFERLLARSRAVQDQGCAMRGIDEQLDVIIEEARLSIAPVGSNRAADGVLGADCEGSAYDPVAHAIYQIACDPVARVCRGRLHQRPDDKSCTEIYDFELTLPADR